MRKKLHTIISGIESLSSSNTEKLSEVSSLIYLKINSDNELKEALKNCDIFWFRLNHKLTEEVLLEANCKYILCAVTGLDHIDLRACAKKKIEVISLFEESDFLKEVRATAEHTIGLTLSLIRKTKNAFKHVEEGNWNRYLFQGTELYKKKIGILGLGRLGKIVADYFAVFGTQVFYYDILKQGKEFENKYTSVNSIEELLKNVDILSIHLPYNKDTHFILNKNLSLLKKGSLVVNTSRGGVLNEEALLNLIKKNHITGYATDVLFNEPEIKNNQLLKYAQKNDNILITPHIAGNTFESIEKTETFVLKKFINTL